jgi:hypothetical protein
MAPNLAASSGRRVSRRVRRRVAKLEGEAEPLGLRDQGVDPLAGLVEVGGLETEAKISPVVLLELLWILAQDVWPATPRIVRLAAKLTHYPETGRVTSTDGPGEDPERSFEANGLAERPNRNAETYSERGFLESPLTDSNCRPLPYHRALSRYLREVGSRP